VPHIIYREENMAKVVIPYPLRKHTNNQREINIDGSNIKETIDTLFNNFPGLKDSLKQLDFMAVFLNGERINNDTAQWPGISVKAEDEISIILPIAGGLYSGLSN
jgi:molybdopterin converting factor small subunit